ncbi:MAG TPA: hypothetical protein PKA76_16675, partial [Pirellulaceae bacterium]|nr:hypothetical protein [Pirellulaceae bacterium]
DRVKRSGAYKEVCSHAKRVAAERLAAVSGYFSRGAESLIGLKPCWCDDILCLIFARLDKSVGLPYIDREKRQKKDVYIQERFRKRIGGLR